MTNTERPRLIGDRANRLRYVEGTKQCSRCLAWQDAEKGFDKLRRQCRECRLRYNRENARKYRVTHPPHYLLHKYGLTCESWRSLVASQNNRCACCGIEMDPRGSKTRRSAVPDHCHGSNMTRSAICTQCNLAEGHILSLSHLKQLARYIFGKDGETQLSLFGKN